MTSENRQTPDWREFIPQIKATDWRGFLKQLFTLMKEHGTRSEQVRQYILQHRETPGFEGMALTVLQLKEEVDSRTRNEEE